MLILQIKGKVNAVTVDSCQRTGLLCENLVAACEIVNSKNIQVQVTGVVPTIAVDKCDGVQVKTRMHFSLVEDVPRCSCRSTYFDVATATPHVVEVVTYGGQICFSSEGNFTLKRDRWKSRASHSVSGGCEGFE